MSDIQQRIERARQLIATGKHASMATVNADGSPHNSPFYLILDPELKQIYFGSHPESRHVQNVLRTGQLFVVVYDLMEKGGLYIRAEKGHELAGKKLAYGLAAHNANRKRDGMNPIETAYYQGGSPQRMYGADITGIWVNYAERGTDGRIIRDYRHEVTREDLL